MMMKRLQNNEQPIIYTEAKSGSKSIVQYRALNRMESVGKLVQPICTVFLVEIVGRVANEGRKRRRRRTKN